MKHPRLKLYLFSFLFAALFSLGFVILENYIEKATVSFIAKKAKGIDGAKLEYHRIHFSIPRLSLVVKKPRLVRGSDILLKFDEITAKFSLSEIFNKKMIIQELHLGTGYSNGFLPDSALYKLLDAIIEPGKPSTSFIKVILNKLTLSSSVIEQKFGNSVLVANKSVLNIVHQENGIFELKPAISDLFWRNQYGDFTLGTASAKVLIDKTKLTFQDLRISKYNSFVHTNFVSDNGIHGAIDLELNEQALGLQKFIRQTFSGSGLIGGSFGDPKLEINLQNKGEGFFRYQDNPFMPLSALSSKIKIHKNLLVAEELNLNSEGLNFKLLSDLKFEENLLAGSAEVSSVNGKLPNADYQGLQAKLDLSGSPGAPIVKITGKLAELRVAGFIIDNLNFNFDSSQQDSLKIWNSDNTLLLSSNNNELSYDLKQLKLKLSGVDMFASTKGKLVRGKLSSDLKLRLAAGKELNGSINLSEQKLNLKLSDQENVNLIFSSDSEQANLKLSIDQNNLADIRLGLECLEISSFLEYKFDLNLAKQGSGQVVIEHLNAGCQSYQVGIKKREQLEIRNGSIDFNNLGIKTSIGDLLVDGSFGLEKTDLKLKGLLPANALLVFVPDLDQLAGDILADLRISDHGSGLEYSGNLGIKNFSIFSESAGIAIEESNGELDFTSESLAIKNFSGSLNNGSFSVAGEIDFAKQIAKNFKFDFQNILVEPIEGSNIELSGVLNFDWLDRIPKLAGTVNVESAILQRNFSVKDLLKPLTNVFSSDVILLKNNGNLPDLELDLAITANRNLFLLTNLMQAEFAGNFNISGTTQNPRIDGNLDLLSGWMGIKDRRFDMTSGVVRFNPSSLTPYIDLVGEARVIAPSGYAVYVVMDLEGSLTAPQLRLDSDSGLSQKEIIALLTSGVASNKINQTYGDTSSIGGFSLLSEESDYSLSRFIGKLTKVDGLFLEPGFNPRTGLIEPSLIAEKYIMERLTLRGQTFFSESRSDSRAVLEYDLSNALRVTGSVDSDTTQKNAALGSDLKYTVLANDYEFLKLIFTGNHELSNYDLQIGTKLSPNSRISDNDVAGVCASIQNYYMEQGHLEAKSSCVCLEKDKFCRKLHIDILEGKVTRIKKLSCNIQDEPIFTDKFAELENKAATRKRLNRYRDLVIRNLREAGYLSARVHADYEVDGDQATIKLNIHKGRRIVLKLEGNKKFTSKQLLDWAGIYKRRLPFGNNSITLLAAAIEQIYHSKGYLEADVQYTIDNKSVDETQYSINVKEGSVTYVSEVSFELSDSKLSDKLHDYIKSKSQDAFNAIYNPKYLIPEQQKINVSILEESLKEFGYPSALVEYKMNVVSSGKIQIVYLFELGELDLISEILIDSPLELNLPTTPNMPCTLRELSIYVEKISEYFTAKGFLNTIVTLEQGDRDDQYHLSVIPGKRIKVDEVQYEGLKQVPQEKLQALIRDIDLTYWSPDKVSEIKRRLLKLGIFSRVELEAVDGKVDSENEQIILRLVEKPLQTLEFGGGVNSELGYHVFGEAIDKSLFQDGRSISARVNAYYDPITNDISRGVAGLRYNDPDFVRSGDRLTVDGRYQRLDQPTLEFDLDRVLMQGFIYRPGANGFASSFGYTILNENLANVSPDAVIGPNDTGSVELGYVSGSFNYDQRDNPINPNQGYLLGLDYKLANSIFGSNADFYAAEAKYSWILPVFDSWALANNTRYGYSQSFDDAGAIPISQRYYLGGRTSVRGFRENSLGPRGSEGSIIGGDMFVSNNLELRYRLYENFVSLIFLDAGNVYLRGSDNSNHDLRYSDGFGIRYLSPIGPIGFDIGRPLDRKEGEPSFRFHFSIGTNY